jgi:hypothetical protein
VEFDVSRFEGSGSPLFDYQENRARLAVSYAPGRAAAAQ